MQIFEIITPGSRMIYEDRSWKRNIEIQFYWLQKKFIEANVALNLFLQDQQENHDLTRPERDAQIEQDYKRRHEISQTIKEELKAAGRSEWEYNELEAEIRFKREQWASGRIPTDFKNTVQFIHARSFLYALDSFEKFLGVLSNTEGVPDEVGKIHQQMIATFPDLLEVRNSAHHIEARVRLIGKYERKITLKTSINEKILAGPEVSAFISESLVDSKYGTTMHDGHYGEVDISLHSMAELQKILQAVLNAFEWDGAMRHAPDI